jgi:hypothetical protein
MSFKISQSGGVDLVDEEESKSSAFYYHPFASVAVDHFAKTNILMRVNGENLNQQKQK